MTRRTAETRSAVSFIRLSIPSGMKKTIILYCQDPGAFDMIRIHTLATPKGRKPLRKLKMRDREGFRGGVK